MCVCVCVNVENTRVKSNDFRWRKKRTNTEPYVVVERCTCGTRSSKNETAERRPSRTGTGGRYKPVCRAPAVPLPEHSSNVGARSWRRITPFKILGYFFSFFFFSLQYVFPARISLDVTATRVLMYTSVRACVRLDGQRVRRRRAKSRNSGQVHNSVRNSIKRFFAIKYLPIEFRRRFTDNLCFR